MRRPGSRLQLSLGVYIVPYSLRRRKGKEGKKGREKGKREGKKGRKKGKREEKMERERKGKNKKGKRGNGRNQGER